MCCPPANWVQPTAAAEPVHDVVLISGGMCGRVVGICVGASAVDNSAEALEAGAAEVRHLIRRKEMPRFNKLTKTQAVVDAIFANGADAAIEPRLQAILKFAMKLSECPSVAEDSDLQALRDAGLGQDEILDLILSAALFGWANRLMHTLGEAVEP